MSKKEDLFMKIVNKIIGNVSTAIVHNSERSAVKSVNMACHAWQYEPKPPKALKKQSKK